MYLGLSLAVMLSAALLCAARVTGMALGWRRGRRIGGFSAKSVLAVPGRYLHDVHDVVARRPKNATMHASLVGGLVVALALLVPSVIWSSQGWLTLVCLLSVAVGAVGLLIELRRRHPGSGEALSGGQYARLALPLAGTLLFVAGMVIAADAGEGLGRVLAPIAALAGLVSLGWLAWISGDGAMRHAFAGLANLALHPRPERFGRSRSTDLRPINLGDADLGAARIEDFTRPQLASFDACVQCGRCEEVCPAFAAGMPLNPKRFVNDLAASLHDPGRIHYAGSPHPASDDAGRVIVLSAEGQWGIAADTVWACTTCRACVEACPMMIEHVDAVIDLRRSEVLRRGAIAPVAQAVLENLAETDTQGGFALGARFDWAADLKLPRIEPGQRAEMLLWVGESAFDRRAQRSLRALVSLLRRAGVEPTILGEEELDCGDQARRLGDEATFQNLARRNVAALNRYEFGALVTADPHALHVLRQEYPAFGGRYVVRHHTDILAELLAAGRLAPNAASAGRITYHDPCYLGRYNGEYDAPRRILAALGAEIVEMERSGPRSHCCGGGGGAPLTDVPGKRRIPDMRMEQAKATGAECVAVACPGCTAMLEGVSTSPLQVRDIAELLDAATREAP